MELTKAQIDLMNLDDQLMDAIQQKLSLAQQIEQYQQHCKSEFRQWSLLLVVP